MAILGVIPDPDSTELVCAWTEQLAVDDEPIEYLCFEAFRGQQVEQIVTERLAKCAQRAHQLTMVRSPSPFSEVLEKCHLQKASRLVSVWFELPDQAGQRQDAAELLKSSPCETCLIVSGTRSPQQIQKTLLLPTGGANDLVALRLAEELRQSLDVGIRIGTVEPDSSAQSVRAGKRFLTTLLHDAALDDRRFEARVIVDQDPKRGILRCYENEDLVIAGRDALTNLQSMQNWFDEATVLVIKRLPSLSFRALPDWFPRIHPKDHADLLHDLRQGSRWSSDFIWMLGLASAIASLGLLQNSPAVVIGSMLLAPLMTPMIGAGLALAEAVPQMAIQCSRVIGQGFLLTLGVSFAIGLITPSRETLSPEIISRGDPNVLDLLIAIFAAVAATVAMARPNISGALAGVAIATALVPPVCTVGLSMASAGFMNAFGAMVLFLTNMIAIVISSSLTFTMLGVSRDRALPRHRAIARLTRIGFVVVLFVLMGPLSNRLLEQLDEGRPQSAVYPVTRAVARALFLRVDHEPGVEITFMGRSAVTDAIVLHIAADHDISPAFADELRNIVRATMHDPEMQVLIVALDGQWLSRENLP